MRTDSDFRNVKLISILNHILYLFFFVGLIFSIRAVTSISIGLILVTGLITNRSLRNSLFQKNPLNFFIAGLVGLFIIQFISLIATQNGEEGWDHIRLKSGLVITPLAFYCSGYLNGKRGKRLFIDYSILLAIASMYCLVMMFIQYTGTGDLSSFFYHQLVTPLDQHAVYFSFYVFTALVFLLENLRKYKNPGSNGDKALYGSLVVFFSIFLFLLSSRLVIIFYLLYLFYYLIVSLKQRSSKTDLPVIKGVNSDELDKRGRKRISRGILILVIISAGLFFMISNPVSKRFSEVLKGDMKLVRQEQYSPADYFNGLQFRLLQWKLVPEILRETNGWLLGVGTGNARFYLDRKYIEKDMYTGDPQTNDTGYLGFNTHNQFLQVLLQNGIIGLLLFLFSCFFLLKMAWQLENKGFAIVILLLFVYAFTESVLETQYGIIIFSFFPLALYLGEMEPEREMENLGGASTD